MDYSFHKTILKQQKNRQRVERSNGSITHFRHFLQGIQRGLQGMRRNAAEIANPRPAAGNAFPAKDGVRAMVELHQNAHLVTASLAAFSAADQMIGSLLDIKA